MKRYLVATIIFIFLISSICYALYLSDLITDDILEDIMIEINNVKNGIETNGEHLSIARNEWESSRLFFFFIVPHDKLDDVNTEFNICTAWSTTEEKDEYYKSLLRLKSAIDIIKNLDRPKLERII